MANQVFYILFFFFTLSLQNALYTTQLGLATHKMLGNHM